MVDKSLAKIDTADMYGKIVAFPDQLGEGAKIGAAVNLGRLEGLKFSNIVLAGMGGSAIGGDLLRSYLQAELRQPFGIHRNYGLPSYVNTESLVICSSYSGTTEETLSAFEAAGKSKASILCISTGGELARLAEKHDYPLIKIPGGLMPRAALGYSFGPLLIAFARLDLCRDHSADLANCKRALESWRDRYKFEAADNPAADLAEKLTGKIVVIYSGPDRFDVVGMRFKGQICENAKQLAFCNIFPEFNHNELVGWELAERHADRLICVMLKDREDHPQISRRMKIVGEVIARIGVETIELESRGDELLSRMFSLIQLGDFASYYLALKNEVDPTPIKVIDYLKQSLAEDRKDR